MAAALGANCAILKHPIAARDTIYAAADFQITVAHGDRASIDNAILIISFSDAVAIDDAAAVFCCNRVVAYEADRQAAHFIPNAKAVFFLVCGVDGCIFECKCIAFGVIFYFSRYAGNYREVVAVVFAYISAAEFEFVLSLCLCLLRQNKG